MVSNLFSRKPGLPMGEGYDDLRGVIVVRWGVPTEQDLQPEARAYQIALNCIRIRVSVAKMLDCLGKGNDCWFSLLIINCGLI